MASAPRLRLEHAMKRMGRVEFWIILALFLAGIPVVVYMLGRPSDWIILLPAALLVASPYRLRDLGVSGWWTVIPCVLALAFLRFDFDWSTAKVGVAIALGATVLALGFVPGHPGRNRFGDRPWGRKADLRYEKR
jgi:uncharacterized membrane protein YhaH (DUF805 family)